MSNLKCVPSICSIFREIQKNLIHNLWIVPKDVIITGTVNVLSPVKYSSGTLFITKEFFWSLAQIPSCIRFSLPIMLSPLYHVFAPNNLLNYLNKTEMFLKIIQLILNIFIPNNGNAGVHWPASCPYGEKTITLLTYYV